MVILSVDYGDSRTGIAVCDSMETLAVPVTVLKSDSRTKLICEIKNLVQQHNANLVVVGLPKNMNGTEGPRAELCKEFASVLEQEINPVPVTMYDERSTTVIAHEFLSGNNVYGKKRKQVVDAVAATVILEDYIKYRKNTGMK